MHQERGEAHRIAVPENGHFRQERRISIFGFRNVRKAKRRYQETIKIGRSGDTRQLRQVFKIPEHSGCPPLYRRMNRQPSDLNRLKLLQTRKRQNRRLTAPSAVQDEAGTSAGNKALTASQKIIDLANALK